MILRFSLGLMTDLVPPTFYDLQHQFHDHRRISATELFKRFSLDLQEILLPFTESFHHKIAVDVSPLKMINK